MCFLEDGQLSIVGDVSVERIKLRMKQLEGTLEEDEEEEDGGGFGD